MAVSRASRSKTSELENLQRGDGIYDEQQAYHLHAYQDNFSTGHGVRPISPLQSPESRAPIFKNGAGRVKGGDFGRRGEREVGASCEDKTIVSLINQKMKEHTEKLICVVKGITRRMAQLDMLTSQIEDSIDGLKDSTEFHDGRTNVKLKEMENMIREVQGGIQELRDKREIAEAQLRLATLQTLKVDTQLQIAKKSPQIVAVQQAWSTPLHHHQPVACPQQPPHFSSNVSPNPPPQNLFHSPVSTAADLSYRLEQNEYPPTQQSRWCAPVQTPNPAYQHYHLPISEASMTPVATAHNASLNQPFSSSPQSSPNKYSSGHHSTNQNPRQIFFVAPEACIPSTFSLSCKPNAFFPDLAAYNQPSKNSFTKILSEHSQAPGNPPIGSASGFVSSVREHSPHLPSNLSTGNDSRYSSLPTAKELPRALPMALSIDSPTSASGNESSLGTDDIIDKVVAMGFRRDTVISTVRKLTENGGSVDPNIVLDKLTSDSTQ